MYELQMQTIRLSKNNKYYLIFIVIMYAFNLPMKKCWPEQIISACLKILPLYSHSNKYFFLYLTLTPVDRTPYKNLDFYKRSIHQIHQHFRENRNISIGDTLLIGFAKINLTPTDLAPLAGYGNRRPKEMTRVHDSIYVNTTVINNGKNKIAIISADLLIIPPEVTLILKEKLFNIDWSLPEIFLSATHTHSSLGGWALV